MTVRGLLLAALGLTLLLVPASFARAAVLQVLHSFAGPDGETPAAALVQGADGAFYGVAVHGGDFSVLPPDGAGTAFRVRSDGSFTTLHVFTGTDGASPISLVLGRDGFFYGTTHYGGQPGIDSLNPGSGVLFRMDTAGNVTVLLRFGSALGAWFPGALVVGADGALYGPAVGGVAVLNTLPGLVYRFDPATADFRVLHNFVLSDGKDPTGPLFPDGDGSLYGTTWQGGPWNSGVIYKVDPAGNFTLLHALQVLGVSEGWEPNGNLVRAEDGSIFGTTHGGGYGGTIFRLDSNGSFSTLHGFDAYASDGWSPLSGLIQGRDGFFYGTAPIGGLPVTAQSRYGVVYRVDAAGNVIVLHTFVGPDGASPSAALVQGADGALYGSTVVGGAFGLGTLFRIDLTTGVNLVGLTFQPNPVQGGSSSLGTVTLNAPAPAGGALVVLSNSNPLAASVPDSLTIPAGVLTGTFIVTTTSAPYSTAADISASYAGSGLTTRLTVDPAPATLALRSLSLSPTTVNGGDPSTGTVTLTAAAPPGGALVALASSKSSVASVPANVTVPQGSASASFPVTTVPVAVSTAVNISATYAGLTKASTLTVTPTPSETDTVAIIVAQYRPSRKLLSVQATSTSALAALNVHVTATGQLIGTLANNGGGKYSGQFTWPSNPKTITVKSNLGGSATKQVTVR